jgi:hypothetical protein
MVEASTGRLSCGMSRPPRFFVAGLPLHVVHRGNNRSPLFRRAEDFSVYCGCAAYASRRPAVRFIRDATQHQWALGDEAFRRNISTMGRRAERLPKRGRRPKRRNSDSDPLMK